MQVFYKTRAYCATCEASIWSDAICGNVICLCGGAHIQNDVIQSGGPVTDEAAFKQQAADDINQPVENVEIVAL